MCGNVYDSVRPLHLLLKLSGFTVFSINTKTLKVTITAIDWILMIFHLLLVAVLNALYWNTYFVYSVEASEIIKSFFPTIAYLNFIIFTGTKIWTFFKRQKFGELLILLQEVDYDFLKMGFQIDYAIQKRTVLKLLAISNFLEVTSIASLYLSQKIYNIEMEFKVLIFTFYGFYTNFALVCLFFALVCGVKARYTVMKDILRYVN